MLGVELVELQSEFHAAISSDQNDLVLDPSIARLKEKIISPVFLEPFSIYSRAQLRKLNDVLSEINTARLKENPLQVALAVGAVGVARHAQHQHWRAIESNFGPGLPSCQ